MTPPVNDSQSRVDAALTITPNQRDPVPTERYVRLLVVTATILLLLALVYVAGQTLYLIQHTVLLFALGGLLAYAFDPVVEVIRGNVEMPRLLRKKSAKAPAAVARKKRPRWLGVLTVFLCLFSIVGTGLFFLGREAIHQGEALARDQDTIRTNAAAELERADRHLREHGIPANLTELVHNPPEQVRAWGESIGKSALGVASHVSRGAVEGIIVLLIAAYFLLYSEELRAMTLRGTPERLRPYVSQWQDDVNRILGGFVRGQAVLAIVLGVAGGLICLLLGLRFWLLIGVFVALASLIPVLGPYIGAVPAVLSALLSPGAHLAPVAGAVVVVVLFSVINEVGSKVLYPRLVGRALGLHEVLVLFALLAGFEVGGITGVLFAAPLTALAGVTLTQLWRVWTHQPPTSLAEAAAEGGAEAKAHGIP